MGSTSTFIDFPLPDFYGAPPGYIRAYNCNTGELVWTFHAIPHPGEPGYETWPPDAYKYAGVLTASEQSSIIEPIKILNRLIMYHWQLKDWPNFTYSTEKLYENSISFAQEFGAIKGLLTGLKEDVKQTVLL